MEYITEGSNMHESNKSSQSMVRLLCSMRASNNVALIARRAKYYSGSDSW